MPDPPPPTTPTDLSELVGTVIDERYKVVRLLGEGGMGAVFEARDQRLDRSVAIKVLQPALLGHEEFSERFLREAKAVSKIRHRNVVELHDFGRADTGLLYSVMEFLVGQDLLHLLATQPHRRLPWSQTCPLLVQIASGLKAAHACGVIHRDIKPANCFLTEEDDEPVVKLVDFGIAKIEDLDQAHPLTAPTNVIGTPQYIAPELIRGRPPVPQSDIYSMGVLAYRMLCGHEPFSGSSAMDVMVRSCKDPVPPLHERLPQLPPPVEHLVMEMLTKEPEDRPHDMADLRRRLVALGRQFAGTATAVPLMVSDEIQLSREGPANELSDETTVPRETVEEPSPEPAPPLSDATTLEPNGPQQAAEAIEPDPSTQSDAPALPDHVDPPPKEVPIVSTPGPASCDDVPSHGQSTDDDGPNKTEVAPIGTLSSEGVARPPVPESSPSEDPPSRVNPVWFLLGTAVLAIGAFVWSGGLGSSRSTEHRDALANATPNALSVPPSTLVDPPSTRPTPSPAPAKNEQETEAPESSPTPSNTTEVIQPSPSAPTQPESSTAPTPPTTMTKKATTGRKRPSKPKGPPKDPKVKQRLEKKIKSNCFTVSVKGPIKISFEVQKDGTAIHLRTTPREAMPCVKARLKEVDFRPRTNSDGMTIAVERSQ